ncbi:unnamed protein product, partial [Mesorhabditis spiculigera]
MDISEASELLSLIIELEVRWHDLRLRWNPANFSGIENIVLPEHRIWTPDFVYYDQAAQAINLIPEDSRYVRVDSHGEASLPMMHLVRTSCNLNMSEFPFDIQYCAVALGTYIYAAKEISYQINIPQFNEHKQSDTYGWHGNSEWDVDKPKAERMKANNTIFKYEYVNIEFTFYRHSSFFMFIIIWPVFLLNILCTFGMFVDKTGDCLNKMILGLTTLMAMAVELEIVAEEMPKTQHMPLLARFVINSIYIIATASVTVLFLPTIRRARKSVPHLTTRRLIQPNLLLLIIFETLNAITKARSVGGCRRLLTDPATVPRSTGLLIVHSHFKPMHPWMDPTRRFVKLTKLKDWLYTQGVVRKFAYVYDEGINSHKCEYDPTQSDVPERTKLVRDRLHADGFLTDAVKVEARPATDDELALVHTKDFIKQITALSTPDQCEKFCKDKELLWLSPGSEKAARLAVGGGLALVKKLGMEKVVALDLDVHAPVGTYNATRVTGQGVKSKIVLFSVHSYCYGLFWPFTQDYDCDPKDGNVTFIPINVQLNSEDEYMAIMNHAILPVLREIKRKMILLAGGQALRAHGWGHIPRDLHEICPDRVIAVLEGGIIPANITESTSMLVKGLQGKPSPRDVHPVRLNGCLVEPIFRSLLNGLERVSRPLILFLLLLCVAGLHPIDCKSLEPLKSTTHFPDDAWHCFSVLCMFLPNMDEKKEICLISGNTAASVAGGSMLPNREIVYYGAVALDTCVALFIELLAVLLAAWESLGTPMPPIEIARECLAGIILALNDLIASLLYRQVVYKKKPNVTPITPHYSLFTRLCGGSIAVSMYLLMAVLCWLSKVSYYGAADNLIRAIRCVLQFVLVERCLGANYSSFSAWN